MGKEPLAGGAEQELDVTRETIEALATKLDAFGAGLGDEERVVLGSLLNAGMQAVSAEVTGFAGGGIEGMSWSFAPTSPLGAEVRRYDIVGAFPKKVEIGALKAGAKPRE